MRPLKASATALVSLALASLLATSALAQCAGCGADYNRADNAATARLAERQRLDRVDPPIQKDPLGNAIIGAGITGLVTGSAAAAARAMVTGTVTGAAIQAAKDAMRRR
jgi:hypothetical protein